MSNMCGVYIYIYIYIDRYIHNVFRGAAQRSAAAGGGSRPWARLSAIAAHTVHCDSGGLFVVLSSSDALLEKPRPPPRSSRPTDTALFHTSTNRSAFQRKELNLSLYAINSYIISNTICQLIH